MGTCLLQEGEEIIRVDVLAVGKVAQRNLHGLNVQNELQPIRGHDSVRMGGKTMDSSLDLHGFHIQTA